MRKFLLLSCIAILSACAQTEAGKKIEDKAREWTAKAATEMYVAECKFSIPIRQQNAAEVQRQITETGHPGLVVAQDCDGDGQKDF